jgi:mannitol/fructose-specific phosphotransferase system IIA component (Ntr-type)
MKGIKAMGISEFLRAECIVLNLISKTKRDVFVELVGTLVTSKMLQNSGAEELVQKLEAREKLSTTGVGEGVAIPHASVEGIDQTVIIVGISPEGIDFASVDGRPVKVIFMIIGSQSVPRLHIQLLARIVRLCRDKEIMEKLQAVGSQNEVVEILQKVES